MRKRKREYYYRKAKKEDYRSRASYKVLQANQRYEFMNLSDVVLDLGAAPGGWLQIAREVVGQNGFVLGVDIIDIEPLDYNNVVTIVGDIRKPETIRRIKAILPRPADAVISDVSPNISGIWEVDHARQIELADCSRQISLAVLKPKGNLFVKTFQGDLFNQFLKKVRRSFYNVKVVKPKASRNESAEVYILGLYLRENLDS